MLFSSVFRSLFKIMHVEKFRKILSNFVSKNIFLTLWRLQASMLFSNFWLVLTSKKNDLIEVTVRSY